MTGVSPPGTGGSGFPRVDPSFRMASILGGILALLVFGYIVFIGRPELTEAPTGNFYDLQARAWLDGQWDIPDVEDPDTGVAYNPLSIEAFVIDGKSYTYYGPLPSALRVPFLLASDTVDGRTTQASLMAAFAAALVALHHLSWRIRWLVRGDVPVHRREELVTTLFTFGLGAGTVLLYLGSQPTVYHEAILWGVAFTFAGLVFVLGAVVAPTKGNIAWAGVFAAAAVLSRVSVGIAVVVALGLLWAVALASKLMGRARQRRDSQESGVGTGNPPPDEPYVILEESDDDAEAGDDLSGDPDDGEPSWPARFLGSLAPSVESGPTASQLVGLLFAAVLPVMLYAGVNIARFDTPFNLPIEQQVFSELDPQRQAALDANDGSIFGLKFVPSTALAYARPDAIDFDRLAPWISFPRDQATEVGDVVFDTRDESSSLPSTMPLLVVLGVVGLVTMVKPPDRAGAPTAAALAIPVIGAMAGGVGVLTIAFIAHRYVGDLFPFLALLALVGLHRCGRWFGGDLSARAVVAGIVLALLGLWGVAANVALSLEYQRLIAPVDPATRTAWVDLQYRLDEGQTKVTVVADAVAPFDPTSIEVDERGELLLVPGEPCLYWSDGFSWQELPDALELCEELGRRNAGEVDSG